MKSDIVCNFYAKTLQRNRGTILLRNRGIILLLFVLHFIWYKKFILPSFSLVVIFFRFRIQALLIYKTWLLSTTALIPFEICCPYLHGILTNYCTCVNFFMSPRSLSVIDFATYTPPPPIEAAKALQHLKHRLFPPSDCGDDDFFILLLLSFA